LCGSHFYIYPKTAENNLNKGDPMSKPKINPKNPKVDKKPTINPKDLLKSQRIDMRARIKEDIP